MNTRLTESEYQSMIISLIADCIDHIDQFRRSGNEEMVDWIYTLERLKVKGIQSDLRVVVSKSPAKSTTAARNIRRQFLKGSERDITTMV